MAKKKEKINIRHVTTFSESQCVYCKNKGKYISFEADGVSININCCDRHYGFIVEKLKDKIEMDLLSISNNITISGYDLRWWNKKDE
jgi:hypothetical protein